MKRECEATVTIDAPPEAVWQVISDVTRVGEWSGECRSCEWVGGSGTLVPGQRFRGTNRRGMTRWARLNEVVVANAPHEMVWHTVLTPFYRDSTEWRLVLRPTAEGTEVTQSFKVLRLGPVLERLFGIIQPAHRDRTQDLLDDLTRLKQLVESS